MYIQNNVWHIQQEELEILIAVMEKENNSLYPSCPAINGNLLIALKNGVIPNGN